MRQVIVRGLDGRSLCIGVDRDSISGADLLSQVALRCGYRSVDNLALLTGTTLVSPGSLLRPDADNHFPSCHVTSRLPGGKGGFGSLLRGAATRAGQKKTTNFDACRDMSGRRLRHVNAEKKLRDWRHEAKERRLEKVAQDYIKKIAKERKRDDKSAETVRQLREQSAQTMDRVAEAVQTALQKQTKRLAIADGKKTAVEDDQDGKKNKLMSLLEGVAEEEEDDDDEDDDSSDECSGSEMEDDDEEEEREDNERRRESGGQAPGSASATGPSTSNPTSTSLHSGSSHPSSSHNRPTHSSAPSRPPLPLPGMPSPFGTRFPFPPPPPPAAAAAAAGAGGRLGRGGSSAPQGLALQPHDLSSIVAMQVAAAVASGAGSGHRNLAALKASVAAAAAAGAAAGAAAAAAAKAAGAVPAAATPAAVSAGDRGQSVDAAPAADSGGGAAAAPSDRAVSGCLSSEADSERQQKAAGMVLGENGDVDWNLVSCAQDLEGLGLERLKSELQSKGLKCGGSLAERAARLFLLKGSRVEDLDPKHLAKPPAAAKGKGKGKAA